MASVAEIWRYPVKSMAGERLESCLVTEHGFEGDRRWAFVDGAPHRAGKLFNIKQHDRLMTYRARYTGGAVEVLTPEGATEALDGSLVEKLEIESARPLQLRDLAGGNFDDEPVLIINLASLAAFGLEAGMAVDHPRFPPNRFLVRPAARGELCRVRPRRPRGAPEARVGPPW